MKLFIANCATLADIDAAREAHAPTIADLAMPKGALYQSIEDALNDIMTILEDDALEEGEYISLQPILDKDRCKDSCACYSITHSSGDEYAVVMIREVHI